ncbi:MAG: tetratricopeptide repeat protein [Myxococcota bacterium]|nr:tetratricopeptide repeat protein [Myxococcota bacterium]
MNRRLTPSYGPLLAAISVALVSGAAALAYEITWSRMLVIPLGNSSDATTLVLAAFMLGIAAGARLLGGVADRVRSPLKLYAYLEIGLGLYALAMPFVIKAIGSAAFLSGSLAEYPWIAVARFATCAAVVVIPSLAMGATLPMLVRAVSGGPGTVRHQIGLVYGANTIGAAMGAAATGFVMIPAIGIPLTSYIGVVLSLFAGAIALLASRLSLSLSAAAGPAEDPPEKAAIDPQIRAGALIAAAASGFVMLGAEVLWARVLTFIFGHDTYAFAVLLAVVLLGLGLGGFLHKKLAGRDPVAVTGVLTGLMGLALLDLFWVAAAITVHIGRDPFALGSLGQFANAIELEFFREILFTPILVLMPSILAGAAFPAAVALYAGTSARTGHRVGTAALVNGIGCGAGALITSFLLVDTVGIQQAFVVLALVAVVASLAVLLLGRRFAPRRTAIIFGAPAALTLAVALIMPAHLPREMLRQAVGSRHQDIVHYEEGHVGTVSVTVNRINGEKQLFMNAVNEVTTRLVHNQSFKFLGHLGPLLHPKPRHGLMICLGAGLSAGAALVHPFKRLDVVELSAAMPAAARFFDTENNRVLDDPRLHLHIDDGRHFLAGSSTRYDTVMVDSTHPKAVDSWILYTQEFYALIRNHLTHDGIVVQWVPLHGLSEQELKIIVRTFFSVFPETTLWVNVGFETYGQAAYLKMVGTRDPLVIDYEELAARLQEPRIKTDLAAYGMAAPEELLDAFLAGPGAVGKWTQGLPIQTDNHPIVPYTTAYASGRRMSAPLLLGVRSSIFPILTRMGQSEADIRSRLAIAIDAQGFLLAGMLDRAADTWPNGKKIHLFKERAQQGRAYYLALAKRYADAPDKLFEIGSYLGNLGYAEEAKTLYQRALDRAPGDPRIQLNLALAMIDLADTPAARSILATLNQTHSKNALVAYNLGVAFNLDDKPGLARPHLKRAVALDPSLISARLNLAQTFIATGDLKPAEAELRALIAQNRWVAEAWDMLGLVAAARRDWPEAKKLHLHALSLEPYRAATHYNLGITLQELGRLKEAAGAYKAALKIDPADVSAHNNLGLVYAGVGLYDLAAASHMTALDLDPGYAEAAFNLGLAYKAQGNLQSAAEAFGLALKIAPTLVQAQEQLTALGIQKEDGPQFSSP